MTQLSIESNAANMLARSFVDTRSRSTDSQTSRDAAKAAVSRKADGERAAITKCVKAAPDGLTAYQVADLIGLDRQETSRRISECGLIKTDISRPNFCARPGAVWVWGASA